MEYEIADEEGLFDPSTNPSLLCERQRPRPPRPAPAGKRRPQKAELIPEEEEQFA